MTEKIRRPAPGRIEAVAAFLESEALRPARIIATDDRTIVLDLSRGGRAMGMSLAGIDVVRFGQLIDRAMADAGTGFAFGRYGEDRELYNNDHFKGGSAGESRTIHMGIDVFCAAGTEVHAPLAGEVSIIANNTQELDYGPMLVLGHTTGAEPFYTLYGHLELDSIAGLADGELIAAGDVIARVGSPPENGNWPPHLHFQVIADLLDLGRDFPGVAFASERSFWLSVSPSPARFFPEHAAGRLNCGAGSRA